MVEVTEENWEEFKREADEALDSQKKLQLNIKYDSAMLLLPVLGKYKFTPEQAMKVIEEHYVPLLKRSGGASIELEPVANKPWWFTLSIPKIVKRAKKRAP
jgi:hypothetical protein